MTNPVNNKIEKLDTTGLLCPLPVLKIQKTIKGLNQGDLLEIISDDPVATIDIPNYCRESGHKLLKEIANGQRKFLIQKK
ncbi:MAG: sulfurtransferase TusA family protein [Paracoccaceae bacterium]|nr:sulfurtransferase TusA family protein [Paracoccaceae bacterium]MDE2917371.1 sulfurtransferase TusA family protein [Paracoccaceae bacterium]